MNPDPELLRQYTQANSQTAFAGLVRRHLDLVYSIALRKVGGDAHAASDVAQAVFIALARNAHSLTARTTLAGWLYVTSRQQAAQWVRAERRRQTREHEAHTMNEIFRSPDIDWDKLRPVLDDLLHELSEGEREAVLLRYFERQPFVEIGRTFRISEDAARMRVDRALEKLKNRLARRGVSSTAVALGAALGHQVMAAPPTLAPAIAGAVAALPAAGTKIFMTLPRLLALAGTASAVAIAILYSKTPSAPAGSVAAVPSHVSPPPAATGSLVAPPNVSARPDPKSDRNRAAPEEREPRESSAKRRAELEHQLAGYRPLLEKLQLTAEQRQAFEGPIMANLRRQADLREYARTDGARPVDQDVAALSAQADVELRQQIRTAFGDAIGAEFEHFVETGPMREFVYHLGEALLRTSQPLSSGQSSQLVELLARYNRDADGRPRNDARAIDLEAVAVAAREFLTPPQILALRQLYAEKP